jgi:hypothetical protein
MPFGVFTPYRAHDRARGHVHVHVRMYSRGSFLAEARFFVVGRSAWMGGAAAVLVVVV